MRDRLEKARLRLFDRLRFQIHWQTLMEGLIILGVVFMPVLSSWDWMLPLFLLLWITETPENGRICGPGWLFLWSVLGINAFLSPGFVAGLPVLWRFGYWFGLAWIVGRALGAQLLHRIVKYLVYSSLIWLIIGFWQLFSGIPTPRGWLGDGQAGFIPVRTYSVFGNPNVYVLYLLAMMVFSKFLIAKSTAKIDKFFLTVIFFVILVAIYFTYTRAAWLLAGFYLVFQAGKSRPVWLLSVAGMMILLYLIFPDFQIRLSSIGSLSDSSLSYRLQIWRGTWEALHKFWLWGAGPGSFPAIYPQYKIGNSMSQHAHQLYLQFWLEHGLTGVLAFLAVVKRMFTGCRHAGGSPEMKALAWVLLIFLAYGLSETWYIQPFMGGFFWFLTGLLQAAKRIHNDPEPKKL
jgi:hypothetical protein